MIDEKNLTHEQKRARLHAKRGKNLFITGGAGTGKSAVVSLIIDDLTKAGKSVVVCAPTGIASLHISGTTIHGAFGFEADCAINDGGSTRGLTLKTRAPEIIRCADVIIIDEISMVRSELFDAVCASIQKAEREFNKGKAKDSQKHIQLIVVGDFYQLPPVVRKKTKDGVHYPDVDLIQEFYHRPIKSEYAFQGIYWDKCRFTTITLTETVRQTDSEFIENLNKARIGDISCIEYFNSHCLGKAEKDAANLYAYKNDVQRENCKYLDSLSGTTYTYRTRITYVNGFAENDIDESVKRDIPADLRLKNHTEVILTANDHHGSGSDDIRALLGEKRFIQYDNPLYVNGTCATAYNITDTIDGYPEELNVVTETGEELLIYPVKTPIYVYRVDRDTNRTKRIIAAIAEQFPIKLAHAITIHSSQGQTYEQVNIDPRVFSFGQLYVCLSRAKTVKGLHLIKPIRPKDLLVDPEVTSFYQRTVSGVHKQGRPTKAIDGSTRGKPLWVPKPLEKHVRAEIEKGHALKMTTIPAFSNDRVHIRVPDNLRDHVTSEISIWRTMTKAKKRAVKE